MKIYAKNTPVNLFFFRYVIGKLTGIDEELNRLRDIIENQNERIETLSHILHEIAPEYEVIETMAETDDERTEMVERYMNHNDYC